MELCSCCKAKECKQRIVITKEKNITTIRCLDYVKDKDKIKGYVEPLIVTAKRPYVIEVEK